MRFFISAKWEEKTVARALMDSVCRLGHLITYDWTQQEDVKDAKELCSCLLDDHQGVADCDVLIAILQKPLQYRGAWVEIGIAMGLDKDIWLICGEDRLAECVFLHHPNVKQRFDTMGEMIAFLSNISDDGRGSEDSRDNDRGFYGL